MDDEAVLYAIQQTKHDTSLIGRIGEKQNSEDSNGTCMWVSRNLMCNGAWERKDVDNWSNDPLLFGYNYWTKVRPKKIIIRHSILNKIGVLGAFEGKVMHVSYSWIN